MKILIVLTSHSELGDTGKKTGFWVEEFAAPYYQLADAGVQITLVAPFPRQLYSGMVPGFVAGHYALEDCVINLAPLLANSAVQWLQRSATGIDAATRNLTLAVNISARQFRQKSFVNEVKQLLAETGADPRRLKFDLTERLVVANVTDTISKMLELKALGIGFSMEDFGTGYSSLSDLKRLPLEQIKIDRSFVGELTTDPNDAAIVRTIITIGHALGLTVLAEGVETKAQLDYLKHYACSNYQGNMFSQPTQLNAFEKALVIH